MLSTILYSDEAVIAIIAGSAYCLRSLFMSLVPSSVGTDAFISAILVLRCGYEFDFEDKRSIAGYGSAA